MSKCLSEEEMAEREAEAEHLEAEMATVCGALNAGVGRLVGLIARVLDTNAWCGWGIRSPEHWVAWKCGVSAAHARKLVHMARRLPELPETAKALQAGEVSEDQVSVVCRHIPAWADAEVAGLARLAGVSQLSATLRRYSFDDDPPAEDEADERPDRPEPRRASFSGTEEGGWRLSATLPPDEGGLVERALQACRRHLKDDGEGSDPSWADALVLMAERALAEGATSRAARDRHTLLVHLRAEDHGPHAYVHLGAALPDSIRRLLGCDGRVRPVVEVAGVPLSVGRAQRLVPERTRVAVEDRDGSCRVPGCGRTRWLQVHHIVHWEDNGPTDTANLVALCSAHHRLHHLGRLGIEGDADDPDGLEFTDHRGRRLTGVGRPAPPGQVRLAGHWVHPSGERLESHWVYFNEPSSRN